MASDEGMIEFDFEYFCSWVDEKANDLGFLISLILELGRILRMFGVDFCRCGPCNEKNEKLESTIDLRTVKCLRRSDKLYVWVELKNEQK